MRIDAQSFLDKFNRDVSALSDGYELLMAVSDECDCRRG